MQIAKIIRKHPKKDVKKCHEKNQSKNPIIIRSGLKDVCSEAAIDEVHHPQDVACQGDPSGEDHMLRVDALL